MGFYREHVLPRLVDRACGTGDFRRWRERVTAGLSGTVVEIGFGSGLNLPVYPPEVRLVYAVEPALTARRLAQGRIAESHVRVEHVALSTFTLCTIPGVEEALAEVRRVLRPGGRFHFLEHGLSPEPRVATWQRRLEPMQKRLADGCHLTRDAAALVRAAGFDIEWVESRYAKGPKPWTWLTAGAATKPR